MKNKSHYIFGAALAGAALGGLPGIQSPVQAVVVTNADFTFENATLSGTTAGGGSFGGFLAEIGTGTAYGVHVSAFPVYSEPAGNGSTKSLSSTGWGPNDYYEFRVPTTGIKDIIISFDQSNTLSTNGVVFQWEYSTGGPFTILSTAYSYGAFNQSAFTTAVFAGGTSANLGFRHTYNLSAITDLNNNPNAVFRLVDFNANGTDQVDNFIVSGTAVPEPASLSLLTISAAAVLLRRRPEK